MRSLLTAAAFAALLPAPAAGAGAAPPVDWNAPLVQLPSYPFAECVVCERELALGATNNLHGARLVRVCSNECWEAFDAGPGWYLDRIDAALMQQQLPGYPLTECPVCDRPLGAEGEPVDHVRGSRLVRLCSDACVMKFRVDPKPVIARVDAALIAAQKADYPTEMCPVMEMEVDAMGTPFDLLHGTRLVRLCCESCVQTFREDPDAWLTKLDALADAAKSDGP